MLCYPILCYALRYAKTRYVTLCYAVPALKILFCNVTLRYVELSQVRFCYVTLRYAMLCYPILCFSMLSYAMLNKSTAVFYGLFSYRP